MMARPKRPLFLAPASYRRRRLSDAARMLPVFGIILLFLPLMWTETTDLRLTSGHVMYFFGVWLFLVVIAAAFAPGLKASDRSGDGSGEDED
jgi:hypothetical protein